MRWASLVAAICLISASQPGHANNATVKLAKPGGTWSTYLNDIAACNPYHPRIVTPGGEHSLTKEEMIATSYKYFGCMSAKGYRTDPNGYLAAQYVRVDGTDILVPNWR